VTITVTVAADYNEDVPRMELAVTASPAVSVPLSVLRVHEDGTEWPLLASAPPKLIGGSWVGFDYHPPLEQDVTYRAVTATEDGESGLLSVPAGANVLWLISASTPALSVQVDDVFAFAAPTHGSQAVAHRILGSSRPVHQIDSPRMAPSGSITVTCRTPAAVDAVLALLADGEPILINTSMDRDVRWMWVQPGDVSVENPAPHRGFPTRRIVIPFQSTSQPDVDVSALWTFDDITALGLTFNELAALYATFNDMTLDNRSV
jgi:hypothetical protein